MLDINFIRQNPEKVKEGIQKKRVKVDLDNFLKIDQERRDLIGKIEVLRYKKNKTSREISRLKNIKEKEKLILEMRKINKESSQLEDTLKNLNKEFDELALKIPIPPAKDVPEGDKEEENIPVKSWGKIPQFNFKPKDYISLMQGLDLLDLNRGAKVGGFRQYFIKNEAVLVEQALLRWSLDFLKEKGFSLFRPTIMVREFSLVGTGMFPAGKNETYQVEDDLFLAGTTEVPLMTYHANEILDEKELPKKYVGISVGFRKEAGSYGKDVKGIFRVHEFWQTEQVILCRSDEKESIKWHEELLQNSEEMIQALNLPYRVVNCCAGDLALGQVKRYDIEIWVPSQQRYRETHSDSYLLDFQSRRLNIRYRDRKSKKLNFVHSLNNTGIAVPRFLIPLFENYQQEDGSIVIPDVLRSYLNGLKKIERKK